MPFHPLNYYAGWSLILAGFVSGAGIGLFFHRDDFLGGYTSLRRRMARLGHIALVALGALNILFAVTVPVSSMAGLSSICWIVGGITMPAICFLTAWKKSFRHAFFVPVMSLIVAVILTLLG
ncbi:MAG TPA: hypothetical protein VHD56_18350 [Tepidisphaeraceae bacterium]|nr:hypothetical protein [Tepidisphaeraceae bacterium]